MTLSKEQKVRLSIILGRVLFAVLWYLGYVWVTQEYRLTPEVIKFLMTIFGIWIITDGIKRFRANA